MRISDWSSDVCSSDLKMGVEVYSVSTDTHFSHKAWHDTSPAIGKINYYMVGDQNHALSNNFEVLREGVGLADRGTFVLDPQGEIQLLEITPEGEGRSEEHTSELQSLMRISYAVFCLKKQKMRRHRTEKKKDDSRTRR